MRQYKFIALLIRSPVLIIAKIVDQLHHLPQDGALEGPVTMPPQDVRRIAIRIAWAFIKGLPANVLPHGGAVSVKSNTSQVFNDLRQVCLHGVLDVVIVEVTQCHTLQLTRRNQIIEA